MSFFWNTSIITLAIAQPAAQAKPGKKEKRQKKPKDAPKKPMSAFFCYQSARRDALKKEAPELNHKDIIKVRNKLKFERILVL